MSGAIALYLAELFSWRGAYLTMAACVMVPLALPLFLEMPGFRVVHACWDQRLIDEYKVRFGDNRLREELIVESRDRPGQRGAAGGESNASVVWWHTFAN